MSEQKLTLKSMLEESQAAKTVRVGRCVIFKFYFVEVELIYNVTLYVYIYILFGILFHYGLSQDVDYNSVLCCVSLCDTVRPCCLSILYNNWHLLIPYWASLVAWKRLPGMRETWFDPWVGKIPWRRKWEPTPVPLPGESHGQRSLAS